VPPIDRSSDGAVDATVSFNVVPFSLRISCEVFTAQTGQCVPIQRQASVAECQEASPFKLAVKGTTRCPKGRHYGDHQKCDGSLLSLFPKVDITTMTTPLSPGGRRCGECRAPTTRLLHPGEGAITALRVGPATEPRPRPAVSTASGREEAMNVVHAVAESPDHDSLARSKRSTTLKRVARPYDTYSSAGRTRRGILRRGGGGRRRRALPAHKMTKILRGPGRTG